ncbi:SIR2 family protein [Sphingobacterium sp.]|uniref:SIR2 family NAD-dependent protein deacylase n=1 Tax=Sphingobacterium sp. TaxID=341027 RepID=UPI0028A83E55|nr:SIR2 family protein [Sphingobacterium sp.]
MIKDILRNEVFEYIADSSNYGNLGLFIGAGMSKAIMNDDWDSPALSWGELLDICQKKLDIPDSHINRDGNSFSNIASQLAKEYSKIHSLDYYSSLSNLKQIIADTTCWYPDPNQRLFYEPILLGINPSWIITTNYDLIIENILNGKCVTLGPDDQLISRKDLIPVYHLHGLRSIPESIVISEEDYISLFRPNQYRQQKLPLLLKESTTLFIGYGLGDFNVLTALDWVQNVYSKNNYNFPNKYIQLLFVENPRENAYLAHNGVIVLEFNNLAAILDEIANFVKEEKKKYLEQQIELTTLNEWFSEIDDKSISNFIDDKDLRLTILEIVMEADHGLVSGFYEFFQRVMDECWLRTRPNGAFNKYSDLLDVLIDILVKMQYSTIPPALFQTIAHNMERVAYYVENKIGKSYDAFGLWNKRCTEIPSQTLSELNLIAKVRRYYDLKRILKIINNSK